MIDLLADIRFAFRTLSKSPGFTLVAITALALGIGANTAIFSIVNAVVLRPLPFPDAGRLVSVISLNTKHSMTDGHMSYPDFQDYRSRNRSFEYLIAFHDDGWTLTGPKRQATNLSVAVVNAGMFPMLGVQPLIGRTFSTEDDESTASAMKVVISSRAWVKYFNRDPRILGRSILLRGLPYTVIGVMPETFQFPIRNDPFDVWTTFGYSTDLRKENNSPLMALQRSSHYLEAWGKLKPGVTAEQAKADLDVITAQLRKDFPREDDHRGIRIVVALERLTERLRPVLLLLLAAVGCVLLIACANVANLLLVRASGRQREIAIRAALGASRPRVARQVLTESLLLALSGGLAGLVVAAFAGDLMIRLSPEGVPRLPQADIDFTVFLFALGVSLLTGILFGLVPALRTAQADPAETLKEGARGTTEGIRSNKARSALIVGEVALALMLLASAGLLLRSLNSLNHVDPGFRPRGVLTTSLTLPNARYDNAGVARFLNRLEEKLTARPEIVGAADVLILPLSGNDISTNVGIEGSNVTPGEQPTVRANVAGVGYFRVMGIPLLAGRDFLHSDTAGSEMVALVNDVFAKRLFPGQNPIGKRIKPGLSQSGSSSYRRIVGVVQSNLQDQIGQPALPEVFIPRNQFISNATALVIRTRDVPQAAIPALRAALSSLDPDIPIEDLRTMDEGVSRSLAQPRFQSFLLAVFAGLALLLTAIGLYGVISYSVAQRTHEIGTRMALGAQRENIFALVVGQGLLLAGAGVVFGLTGTLLVTRFLSSLLYGVAPNDPATLAAITVLIVLVATVASFLPARRAANVDPLVALRYE